jgi:photosystem II stability/assembly factor-like uncharacterized protein
MAGRCRGRSAAAGRSTTRPMTRRPARSGRPAVASGPARGGWRSTDGGASWAANGAGLPDQHCYFTVLRQAMTTDRQDPAGVYFGTNSGSVFASRDEGESWDEIARHLPGVLCVEVLEMR